MGNKNDQNGKRAKLLMK